MPGERARRLRAFHLSEGWEYRTPLRGVVRAPDLVHEVTEITEDGQPLYEARIFDAGFACGEMIHPITFRSTLLAHLARWWSRETGLEPPRELIGESPRNHRRGR